MQRGRKRRRDTENWKKRKKKQEDTNINTVNVRLMEKNWASCQYKCNENFLESDGLKIFDINNYI